jgi:hypothetical protein
VKFELSGRTVQKLEGKAMSSEEDVKTRYEAPAIESVMTAEDMEREVAYAGSPLPSCALTKSCGV